MELTLEKIVRWVETSDLDEEFSMLEEEDPEWFEHQIHSLCDDETLLKFAENRKSSKREYFANILIASLCWIYRQEIGLPYHLSRFRGLMAFEEYKDELLKAAAGIYEKCKLLEKIRNSEQEEIKNIGNRILDFRNDRRSLSSEKYYNLIKNLSLEVQDSFKPNITSYQVRICKSCKSDFRYWHDGRSPTMNIGIKCSKCGAMQA
nr:hypothetical protein [uncultured Pseudomonas sp.]